jgi:hypothetical protein
MGPGIETLVRAIEQQFSGRPSNALAIPTQPDYGPNVFIQTFSNSYPFFDDENNRSLIVHLTCNGIGIMFTGDMEENGWEFLLNTNPHIAGALGSTDIFVASHHGRRSGCCDRVSSTVDLR